MENFSSESSELFGNWKQRLTEQSQASWKYNVTEEITVQNKALLQLAIDKVCVMYILMNFVTCTYIGKTVKNWVLDYILK